MVNFKKEYFGKDVPKLGFGLMRLPKNGEKIDIEQTKQMVDMFMEAGFTYFDTAFVYNGSEEAAKEALVDRYPRESYTLATKINASAARSEEDAKKQFYTSLERTGAGYFDYYLLHAFKESNYRLYNQYHLWDFVKEQKAKGLIKYIGFSYHDGPKLLDEILTEHPDVDFIQLQINYADWDDAGIASKANYEVALRHGKSIVIMEPVKGGTLADPDDEIKKIFKEYAPDMSYASWAIRFAASLTGVITVLSGMSDISQMRDNLAYMRDFKPLDDEEQKIIQKAQRILGKSSTIPCTACQYCVEGCPQQIKIPDIFAAMNKQLGNGRMDEAKAAYEKAAMSGSTASDCVACGLCELSCPQHIPVIENLKRAVSMFE